MVGSMVISPRWYLWHLSKDGSVRAKLLQLCLTVAAPGTVACQAPLSMEFFRPEYWSGKPFASPEDLPKPGIEPRSPTLQADSLQSEPPGKPKNTGLGSQL